MNPTPPKSLAVTLGVACLQLCAQPALMLDSEFKPSFGPSGFWPSTLVVQPNGKVVVGGAFAGINGTVVKGLARLNTDGTIDTGFRPVLPDFFNLITSVAVDRDGKVIVLGMDTRDPAPRGFLTRLLADGRMDPGFHAGIDGLQEFVLAPDNKIVLSGASWTENGSTRSGIARLNVNGTLDTTFKPAFSDGQVTGVFPDRGVLLQGFPPPEPWSGAGQSAIALQKVGKHCEIIPFTFFRLNEDGSEDEDFNRIHYRRVGECPSPFTVHIRAEGTIVVGGQFSQIDGMFRSGLARLDANGLVDDAFIPQWDRSALLVATDSANPEMESLYILGGRGVQQQGIIARLDSRGGLQNRATFELSGGWIYGMAASGDGAVFVWGGFSRINGEQFSGLARFRLRPVLNSPAISAAELRGTIGGELGWSYRVETSADLVNWTPALDLPSAGAQTAFTVSHAGFPGPRFYRVSAR